MYGAKSLAGHSAWEEKPAASHEPIVTKVESDLRMQSAGTDRPESNCSLKCGQSFIPPFIPPDSQAAAVGRFNFHSTRCRIFANLNALCHPTKSCWKRKK